jgi:hypothetical protein
VSGVTVMERSRRRSSAKRLMPAVIGTSRPELRTIVHPAADLDE